MAKRALFTIAGAKYDRAAKKQNKEYHFIFVRSDGAQLREITKIVEQHHIVPRIDPRVFTLETAQDALALVKKVGSTERYSFRWTKKDKNDKQERRQRSMKLYEISFSPTGGTKKVADCLAEALSEDIHPIDLTEMREDFRALSLKETDTAVIAVPSYGGETSAPA